MISSAKTVIVTGVDGFVGTHLAQRLHAEGIRVLSPKIALPTDFHELEKLRDQEVTEVVHLAGMSAVPDCQGDPVQAYSVNGLGSFLLAKKVADIWPRARFIFTSTAQVYSPDDDVVDDSVQFTEQTRILPQNVYAESKWMAEALIEKSVERLGIEVTVLRLFNHTHKSQRPDFFLPVVYHQILKGKETNQNPLRIEVGNLDVQRDIGAISDLISALMLVVNCDRANRQRFEVFNICSGSPKNLRMLAQSLANKMSVNVEFVTDPKRIRNNEIKSVCGSYQKFSKIYGWKPKAQSIDELLVSFFE